MLGTDIRVTACKWGGEWGAGTILQTARQGLWAQWSSAGPSRSHGQGVIARLMDLSSNEAKMDWTPGWRALCCFRTKDSPNTLQLGRKPWQQEAGLPTERDPSCQDILGGSPLESRG